MPSKARLNEILPFTDFALFPSHGRVRTMGTLDPPLLLHASDAGRVCSSCWKPGCVGARTRAHSMSMTFLAYCWLRITAFWAIGFGLMFGGSASLRWKHSGRELGTAGASGRCHCRRPGHSTGAPGMTGFDKIWGFRVGGKWFGVIGGRGFFLALPTRHRRSETPPTRSSFA